MRAFPADIAFVDMGGNPMVFLPSVHTSELEELAAKNLSKANLLKALETKLFRVQLLDFSADGEGIAMRLVSLDENGNPQGDYEDITLRGSPATSQPAIAFWGASFLSTEAETYFRNKEVAFIHNAEIGVEELSGRLIIKEDENKRATVKGLLVTQGNNPKNRIIYEVGNPITFKMDSEGNPQLQAAMSVQPKHQAGLFDANGKFQIINGQAPCVLSWDFNTDATAKKADAEANGGRDDINKLEFGATGWPVAASPTTGHPSDKAASVNPVRAQNPAGALSHTVTYKNMVDVNANNAAIPDDANVVTINHIAANHRKTYSMRAVFGFSKDKTPQTLWQDGNREPYQLKGGVASQYRAYDFTLRVALEKYVGANIPANKKPSQNPDNSWNLSSANGWLKDTFNTPEIPSEQLFNELHGFLSALPWSRVVSDPVFAGEQFMGIEEKTIVIRFAETRALPGGQRAVLARVMTDMGTITQRGLEPQELGDGVEPRDVLFGNVAVPTRTYVGRPVQIAPNLTAGGAHMRVFPWRTIDNTGQPTNQLIDFILVGIGVGPRAFNLLGDEESTQDEVEAVLIHDVKHLQQAQDIRLRLNDSPYWKIFYCTAPIKGHLLNPFLELEAYLTQMFDKRVSYRFLLRTEAVDFFVTAYDEAVKLVETPADPKVGWQGAHRIEALKILERAWKIVSKTYPELQKGNHEYSIRKPKPKETGTPPQPDAVEKKYIDGW
jgi:hypothetical protein